MGIKKYLGVIGILGIFGIWTHVLAEVSVIDSEGNFIGTYTTIQAGIDACPEGGTVSVAAGTYTEAIYITKGIALVGIGTPTITAQGFDETNTVTFDGTATNNALIFGFRITGASGWWPEPEGNGIMCINQASPTIINNTISGNEYDGIYCNNSSPTITNNTILGNENGIYCDSSSPVITNNTISENNADGIVCNNSSPTITNNTISGNHQRGISCYSSSPTITNNIISGNKQDGIVCNNSSPTITNNTISGNNWHGIICFSSSPTITNNIITENGTQSQWGWGCGIDNYDGTPTINYNCVWGNGQGGNNNYSGCSAGLNDISFNPQFIDGDYRLGLNSPCIDAGTNTAQALPTTDKDGNLRIIDGNGDGIGVVDMGAYEFSRLLLRRR